MTGTATVWQPLYFPKLHYLARLAKSDVFVIFDNAEFSRSSRQHRTQIDFQNKTWLTIPIKRSTTTVSLDNARVDMSQDWIAQHLGTLQAKYGGDVRTMFEEYYTDLNETSTVIDITVPTLKRVVQEFDIDVDIYRSSELDVPYRKGNASEYNARLANHFDCDVYFCGQNAYEGYLDTDPFEKRNIDIRTQDWNCPWNAGNVICLDVLFNVSKPQNYIR
jgi:hypothetical protein